VILGLSHIGINCINIQVAAMLLSGFGYKTRFDIKSLQNHSAKSGLMQNYLKFHDIKNMEAKDAMSIELLDHGSSPGPQSSAVIPIFSAKEIHGEWEKLPLEMLPLTSESINILEKKFKGKITAFYIPALNMTCLLTEIMGQKNGLYSCVLPTVSPYDTEELLQKLRFRKNLLGFWSIPTPIKSLIANFTVLQSEEKEGWSAAKFLDSPGAAVIALMARDTKNLKYQNLGQCTSFSLVVNEKKCWITLIKPKFGPIIELVEHQT